MKRNMSKIYLLSCVALVSACSPRPLTPTPNAGDPERLIDLSSEVVTLSLASPNALSKLSNMISQDPPARATLSCSFKDTRCTQAKELFDRRGIPLKTTKNDKAATVELSYERVVTRDCNPRYTDDLGESVDATYPAFGCSVSGNIVQMVSDKKQFTNPSLLDFPDGEKAVQNYRKYLKPSTSSESSGAMSSATGAPPK